jgi:hypothetical protein
VEDELFDQSNRRGRLTMRIRGPERRAIGSVMRRAERKGLIRPPEDLQELVAGLPYTPEEVDDAFDLLVTAEGATIGGTVALADVDDDRGAAMAA